MTNIREIVVKYLRIITLIMVVIILGLTVVMQVLSEQRQAKADAEKTFVRVRRILAENQNDIEDLEEEYSQTCLYNAEAIAYIIQHHPTVLNDRTELKKIAEFIGVDEIHIIDKTGRIFMGTHPEYYNYTFDSGEQIGYFKPMLYDKSLKLCQDITPNTAENKLMQYSALWSENGEFIVQVGMEPRNVMKVTEKNELSHIFEILKVNVGVDLYAIDIGSGEIKGATASELVGKNVSEIGLNLMQIREKKEGFHAKVNGSDSYCVFNASDTNLIGRVVTNDVLYEEVPIKAIEIGTCLILVAIILVVAVTWYINKFVINGINGVNEKLRIIADGNLDEKVDVQTTLEFEELSDHINNMIESLLYSTKKLSYVLDKTNLNIGVYEYNEKSKLVRITERIPKILNLSADEADELSSDFVKFKEYINRIRKNRISEEDEILRLDGDEERYVKIEEIYRENDVLGIVIDATEEMAKRRQIEAERDIDSLTGLYNRRGLDNKLSELFAEPEKFGYGALIMIDADGLKEINDEYGHEKGDMYLKKISEVISSFGQYSCIISRQGGDEFVIFLYNYPSKDKLMESIATLEYIQDNSTAYLGHDLSVPIRFSFGYSLTKGESDYIHLIKQADKKMYENKSERKKM